MSLSVERQRGELPDDRRSPAWLTLAAWIALSAAAGAVGAIASVNSREFYASLERSPWAPPGEVFGPVWTTLYVLMGIAAWLVWRERPAEGTAAASARRNGLVLFVVQLALNALWTWLFFRWRQGAFAFWEIVVLWLAIAVTMYLFARVNRLAALLLLPYLGWVTFATALTLDVWRRNPGLL
jgi:translocator protein